MVSNPGKTCFEAVTDPHCNVWCSGGSSWTKYLAGHSVIPNEVIFEATNKQSMNASHKRQHPTGDAISMWCSRVTWTWVAGLGGPSLTAERDFSSWRQSCAACAHPLNMQPCHGCPDFHARDQGFAFVENETDAGIACPNLGSVGSVNHAYGLGRQDPTNFCGN